MPTSKTAERDDLSKLEHQALNERDHYVKERDKLAAELKSLRDSGVELPEHDHHLSCDNGRIKVNVYFKDTLERYGDRGAMEERERAAKVCESRSTPGTGSVAILLGAAEAIRKGE